jgi:hypothetical protein
MRASDSVEVGSEALGGMYIQRPGSKCIGTGVPSAFPVATLVTSLTVCTYDTPLRKISDCFARPRLGTLPRGVENERVSVIKFSSRTLSLWVVSGTIKLGNVGGGTIGLGNVVVDGGPLLGRNIKLKPVPAKVPLKFARTPKGGSSDGESEGLDLGSKLRSTCWIWKPEGAKIRLGIAVSKSIGVDMATWARMGLEREQVKMRLYN